MTTLRVSALIAIAGLSYVPSIHAHGGASDEAPASMPHYYVAAPLGGGVVNTYVTRTKADDRKGKKPVQIGIEIPAAVMNNLPESDVSMAIDLPSAARSTPFQYMMLDWNAHGHEPAGIYDQPHFDFHFYIQDLEDVMDIKPGACSGLDCDDYAKAMKPLPSEFAPEGYINVGSVVPFMGNHLVDPTSPEFNGKLFTRTWLYGTYDGEITFYEPMITRKSLVEDGNQCTALKLPSSYAKSGYYPTKYCTQYDERQKMYRIFVSDFVYREQPR